jgi:hypothetical protein
MAEAAWAVEARGDSSTARALLDRSIEAQRQGARYAAASYIYRLTVAAYDDETAYSDIAYSITAEGLARAEEAGDALGAIGLREAHAVAAAMCGRAGEGLEHAERALAEARAVHQPTLEAVALYTKAFTLAESDPPGAIELLHEALALMRRLGIELERIAALGLLTVLESQHGDTRAALATMREQATLRDHYVMINPQPFYLGTQAFNRTGRPELVARCDPHCRGVQGYHESFWATTHEQAVQEARARLSDEVFEQLAAEGAAIPPEEFEEIMLREIEGLIAAHES